MGNSKKLSATQVNGLMTRLKMRFEENMHRHQGLNWLQIQSKLENNTEKLWSLNEMERTGGDPDIVVLDSTIENYTYYDCSIESPKGRRSLCYDGIALHSRKQHKPQNSALDMANVMGIELLSEDQYRALQQFDQFDTKTSSWVKTPTDIRELGGAIFCDFRYNRVFSYHNGADSYYAARGFRGFLKI